MNLEDIDAKIEAAQERWETNIPRGDALDAAVGAVLEKLLTLKSRADFQMESQRKATKEEIEFLEGVIDILNQMKTETGES